MQQGLTPKKEMKYEIKTRYRFHLELRREKRTKCMSSHDHSQTGQNSEVISGKVNKVARGRTSARVAIHGCFTYIATLLYMLICKYYFKSTILCRESCTRSQAAMSYYIMNGATVTFSDKFLKL